MDFLGNQLSNVMKMRGLDLGQSFSPIADALNMRNQMQFKQDMVADDRAYKEGLANEQARVKNAAAQAVAVLNQPEELQRQALTGFRAQANDTGDEQAVMVMDKLLGADNATMQAQLTQIALAGGADLPASAMKSLMGAENKSALKAFKGDLIFEDKNGNFFSQQTFVDPNAGVARGVLTDVTGQGLQPSGELTPVNKMGQSVGEKISDAGKTSQSKAEGANKASNIQSTYDLGSSAATSIPDIERGLELVETVSQGGFASNQKAVTDYFGVTSGDVGELNRILGSNILQGLAAFKGAISDGERKFLAEMEGGLASGKEFNKSQLNRMNNIYKKQVKKGLSQARSKKNQSYIDNIQIDLEGTKFGQELFGKKTTPTSDAQKRLEELRSRAGL